MSLSIPRYLSASGVQSPVVRHVWDDWDIGHIEDELDGALVERLTKLHQRAVLAVATGMAEWVVYRFQRLEPDPAPWDFLEAAWAMAIHIRYSNYGKAAGWAEYAAPDEADDESVPERWSGPIRGPIHRVLITLESAIQELAWHGAEDPAAYSQYVAECAGCIHNHALHVMADQPGPYLAWLEQVLQRLEAIYSPVASDALGDVVPRAFIDPELAVRVDQAEVLVNAFLADAHIENPFLSDPAAMLEPIEGDADFVGTPYLYSLAADRAARQVTVDPDDHAGHGH